MAAAKSARKSGFGTLRAPRRKAKPQYGTLFCVNYYLTITYLYVQLKKRKLSRLEMRMKYHFP